jgi:hypothetical protein
MKAEFNDVLQTVENAVAACIRLKRWEDLEAAIAEYAKALGVDASLLLFSAIVAPMVRRGLAFTDPAQLAELAEHIQAGIELSNAGWSLHQSIEFLKDAERHRPAFVAFDAIGDTLTPSVRH